MEKKVRGDEKVSSAMLLVHSLATFEIDETAVPHKLNVRPNACSRIA